MREIKVRGIGVESGEWHYGNLKVHKGKVFPGGCVCYISPITGDIVLDEIKPETAGQYTTCLDKNGKDIWEGDIVKWTHPKRGELLGIGSIEWSRQDAAFTCRCNFSNYTLSTDSRQYEIIGNIHQNPELLNPKDIPTERLQKSIDEIEGMIGAKTDENT